MTVDIDLLILGHTHVEERLEVKNKRYINVGSSGEYNGFYYISDSLEVKIKALL